jgi:NADH-dependent peroxiredoxin subunit F
MQYDVLIIGGGPAAVAAAVYAARKRLSTLLVTESFGGQSIDSNCIYNWIGTPEVSGQDLAKALEAHARAYATPGHTLTIMQGRVTAVSRATGGFSVSTAADTYQARSVLVATGSRRRKLAIPGADTFEHKGVMYCATCDGPLFAGQPVAVIGGGNAALEAVLQLAQYASHVTLLHRSETFRADPITVQQVEQIPHVTLHTNVELKEVLGTKFVSGIRYVLDGKETELPVNGIFVEIGQLPNTELLEGAASLDEHKKVVVDPLNQRTSTPGIWAAGDCTNGLYHQNNIAAGDAVKAIEDLYIWLKTGK